MGKVIVLGWNQNTSEETARVYYLTEASPLDSLQLYCNICILQREGCKKVQVIDQYRGFNLDGIIDYFNSLDELNCKFYYMGNWGIILHNNSDHQLQVVSVSPQQSLLKNYFKISVTMVSCGEHHAIMMTSDKFYAIGCGTYGELGLGDHVTETFTPVAINLPPSDSTIPKAIAAGTYHSCLVTYPYGEVYSFGSGSYCRLGHTDSSDLLQSDRSTFFPRKIESLVGVGTLNANGTSKGIEYISCGTWHTVAIAEGTRDVFGWGWNNFGQLGASAAASASSEGMDTMINAPRRLTFLDKFDGDKGEIITHVSCGSRHTCLLTSRKAIILMGRVGLQGGATLESDDESVSGWANPTSPSQPPPPPPRPCSPLMRSTESKLDDNSYCTTYIRINPAERHDKDDNSNNSENSNYRILDIQPHGKRNKRSISTCTCTCTCTSNGDAEREDSDTTTINSSSGCSARDARDSEAPYLIASSQWALAIAYQ